MTSADAGFILPTYIRYMYAPTSAIHSVSTYLSLWWAGTRGDARSMRLCVGCSWYVPISTTTSDNDGVPGPYSSPSE